MTDDRRSREAPPRLRCLVCVKRIGPGELWSTVHFRGSEYVVCGPSCAEVFNRWTGQLVEQP